jgi:hypothetical protein
LLLFRQAAGLLEPLLLRLQLLAALRLPLLLPSQSALV